MGAIPNRRQMHKVQFRRVVEKWNPNHSSFIVFVWVVVGFVGLEDTVSLLVQFILEDAFSPSVVDGWLLWVVWLAPSDLGVDDAVVADPKLSPVRIKVLGRGFP